jgi:hypothetical protein
VSESYISAELRRFVNVRAQRRCEYCLIFEEDTYFGFQIDHVISEKHGGPTEADNLVLACAFCNSNKGSDVASIDKGVLTRLFHPRQDRWDDHFQFVEGRIEGLTSIGRATVKLLGLNDPRQIEERKAMSSPP